MSNTTGKLVINEAELEEMIEDDKISFTTVLVNGEEHQFRIEPPDWNPEYMSDTHPEDRTRESE